jgi:hypothetical protein
LQTWSRCEGAVTVEVVGVWTGKLANLLRVALRFTNEAFAQQLGTAVRTVAKWSSEPELVPMPELQRALDTMLTQADEHAQQRFSWLVGDSKPTPAGPAGEGGAGDIRMANDPRIGQILTWLDDRAGWAPGAARRYVLGLLKHITPTSVRDRAQARARVGRRAVANALTTFYVDRPSGYAPYQATYDGHKLSTSLLTRADWLDLGIELGSASEHAALRSPGEDGAIPWDEVTVKAAAVQVATAIASGAAIVNSPLYRLQETVIKPGRINLTFGLTDFVTYALTLDLLEHELADAISRDHPLTPANLPLRSRYLPTAESVVDVGNRLCAGGPLALFAAARPAKRGRDADYVLLVQERSGRVLNSARRLAVIPKAFHQPLVDFNDDSRPSATLEREMEEELFGRADVDSTMGGQLRADPLHLSRLSDPMRWLMEHAEPDHWRMECTGFGFNLVSGNYEIASLIVVEDEEWWGEYGGHIEANWESDRLRRYSSRDAATIGTLVHDESWSNEGLFAFIQGLRRLSETGGRRVDLPTIAWEL